MSRPGRQIGKRGRLSLTSLIDVIFLLLLFFMLSSTFSRFGEIDLTPGGSGASAVASTEQRLFLRLSETGLSLNGRAISPAELSDGIEAQRNAADLRLILAVAPGSRAQALADTLLTLRAVAGAKVTVLRA
ncbi:MAG: ExbD/TolR family protein [Mangrovicoccus sp.]